MVFRTPYAIERETGKINCSDFACTNKILCDKYSFPIRITKRLHALYTHTQNDTCIYCASVCLLYVNACVCWRLLRSFSFISLFYALRRFSFDLATVLLCIDCLSQFLERSANDFCKCVWFESILLGLITSWQICTPHLPPHTHLPARTHKELPFTFDYAIVAVSIFSTL